MRFDRIVIVDWSAANQPRQGKDSIWIAAHDRPAWNPATRAQAATDLRALCEAALMAGERLLIGADFAFGYPAGFAPALTGQDDPLAIWDWLSAHVQDDARNRSNRFHVAALANARLPGLGPFWFRPSALALPDLPLKGRARHGHGMVEHRTCETLAPGAQSVWKLGGVGSVGSQALTGIPVLNALRHSFGDALSVWPFQAPTTPIVLAEVFPSLIAPAIARHQYPTEIKDAAQVRLLAQALWRMQETQGLEAVLDTPAIAQTEGWILGLGHQDALAGHL